METLEDFESTIANNVAVGAAGGASGETNEEGIQIDDNAMKEAQTTAAALRRRVSENVLRAKAIGTENVFGAADADTKLSEKAAKARAVNKPTAEEVAQAQKARIEALKSGDFPDAKEL